MLRYVQFFDATIEVKATFFRKISFGQIILPSFFKRFFCSEKS